MKLKNFFISCGLLLAVMMWSSDYVGVREVLHSFTPGALALCRYLIASLVMLIIYCNLSQRTPVKLMQIPKIYTLGAFGIAGYNIGLNFGEKSVSSGIASFVVSQMPIVMALLGYFFLKEKMSKIAVIGMLAGCVGISIIAISGEHQINFENGLLYIILATLGACIYSVFQKPYLSEFNAIEFTCFIVWGGTVTMLGYLPELLREIPHAKLLDLEVLCYLGIFPAALAYIFWAYAIAKIPVGKAGAYLYLSPLLTIVIARLSLGEMPTHLALIGGMISLLGATMVGLSQERGVKQYAGS